MVFLRSTFFSTNVELHMFRLPGRSDTILKIGSMRITKSKKHQHPTSSLAPEGTEGCILALVESKKGVGMGCLDIVDSKFCSRREHSFLSASNRARLFLDAKRERKEEVSQRSEELKCHGWVQMPVHNEWVRASFYLAVLVNGVYQGQGFRHFSTPKPSNLPKTGQPNETKKCCVTIST